MNKLFHIKHVYWIQIAVFSILVGLTNCGNNQLKEQDPRVGVVATPKFISFYGIEANGESFVNITNYDRDTVIINNIVSTDPGYSLDGINANDTLGILGFKTVKLKLNYANFEGTDTASVMLIVDRKEKTDTVTIRVKGPRKAVARNLSKNSFSEKPADISPDNSRILFESNRDGGQQVYTMTLTGDSLKQINDQPGTYSAVKYTNDGTKILYYSFIADTTTVIYLYDLGTQTSEKVLEKQGYNVPVDISSDGLMILFNKRVNSQNDVYIIETDTKLITKLVDDPARDEQGVFFEPRDQRVMYMAIDNFRYQMYKIRVTGEDNRKISDGVGEDIPVATTSDGSYITFYTDRLNKREVMISNWDGGNQISTTDNLRYDYPVDINKQYDRVVYMSSINGNVELFESGYRGEVEVRLTLSIDDDRGVRYSRDGKYILAYRLSPQNQVFLIDMRTYR